MALWLWNLIHSRKGWGFAQVSEVEVEPQERGSTSCPVSRADRRGEHVTIAKESHREREREGERERVRVWTKRVQLYIYIYNTHMYTHIPVPVQAQAFAGLGSAKEVRPRCRLTPSIFYYPEMTQEYRNIHAETSLPISCTQSAWKKPKRTIRSYLRLGSLGGVCAGKVSAFGQLSWGHKSCKITLSPVLDPSFTIFESYLICFSYILQRLQFPISSSPSIHLPFWNFAGSCLALPGW